MRRVHPPQREAGGGGGGVRHRGVSRLLRRAAVSLRRAGPRRGGGVEARPRRRDGLVAVVQVRHAGERPRPLPVVHVHPQRPHQPEAPGGGRRHHVRAAARREGPRPGALGPPVRGARLRPHCRALTRVARGPPCPKCCCCLLFCPVVPL